jgi:hypothetical protein
MQDRSLNRTIRLASLAALLLAGACATGPRIVTNADPDGDFRQYRTFAFEKRLGTDRESGTRTLLSHHLVEATTAEMQKRGYELVEDNPDLLINFYVSTTEKIDVRSTPGPFWGGYYGYRTYGAWSGYETRVTQYTEGTLNVDVIDARKNQLVWEGAMIGRVRDLGDDGLQARVQQAIRELFGRYTYQAGMGF